MQMSSETQTTLKQLKQIAATGSFVEADHALKSIHRFLVLFNGVKASLEERKKQTCGHKNVSVDEFDFCYDDGQSERIKITSCKICGLSENVRTNITPAHARLPLAEIPPKKRGRPRKLAKTIIKQIGMLSGSELVNKIEAAQTHEQ